MITRKTLKLFLEVAGKKLEGEWVVIGGTVLPMLGVQYRSTVDIDFISKTKKEETLKLMKIADELGLGVETINQAGAFFLYQISDFQENLIPLHEGSSATIYRPNLKLYVQLKMDRLSESDLSDCIEYIKYSRSNNEEVNYPELKGLIDKKIKSETNSSKIKRLKHLLKALNLEK